MDGNIEFRTSVYNPSIGSSSTSLTTPLSTPSSTPSTGPVAKSFSDTLSDALHEVNKLQKEADRGMQDLSTGKTDNIPEVMIAAEKADLALKLMVQVRNKIIDAYHEVMKMQV